MDNLKNQKEEKITINKVCELYDQGFGIMIKTVVNNYLEEKEEELSDYQKKELKLILHKSVCPKERCIVTTHAYFMMMNLDSFSDYEIIGDEDILMTLFKRNGAISLQDIRQMLKNRSLKKEIRAVLYSIGKKFHFLAGRMDKPLIT